MAFAAGGLTFALGACSSRITDEMHVRNGLDPKFQDVNVQFRTTYYFRTYDICEAAEASKGVATLADMSTGKQPTKGDAGRADDRVFLRKEAPVKLLKDSLYRFTMTGKSSPLSHVHFESGTLKSYQIDPFGSVAAYDKENNRFYFKSQESTQSDAGIGELMSTVARFSALRASLPPDDPARALITNVIANRINDAMPGATRPVRFELAEVDLAMFRDQANLAVTNARAAVQAAVDGKAIGVDQKLLDSLKPSTDTDSAVAQAQVVDAIEKQTIKLQADKDRLDAAAAKMESALAAVDAPDGDVAKARQALVDAAGSSGEPEVKTRITVGIGTPPADFQLVGQRAVKRALEVAPDVAQTLNPKVAPATLTTALNVAAVADEIANAFGTVVNDYRTKATAALDDTAAKKAIADEAKVPANAHMDAGALAVDLLRAGAKSLRDAALKAAPAKGAAQKLAADKLTAAKTKLAAALSTLGADASGVASQFLDAANETMAKAVGDAERDRLEKDTAAAMTDDVIATVAAQKLLDAMEQAKKTSLTSVAALNKNVETVKTSAATAKTALERARQLRDSVRGNPSPRADDGQCPEGTKFQRGFQVLGPEGLKTFNQDDRLLMAMSSSAEPLMKVLQELSDRVLQQKVSQSDRLLPLAQERVRLLSAQQVVGTTPPDDGIGKMIDNTLNAFGEKTP